MEILDDVDPWYMTISRKLLARLRASAILQVNNESRQAALKYYQEVEGFFVDHKGRDCWGNPFYFNPSFDTVVVGQMCDPNSLRWPPPHPSLELLAGYPFNDEFQSHIQHLGSSRCYFHWTEWILPQF